MQANRVARGTRRTIALLTGAILLAAGLAVSAEASTASAVTGNDFQPGNIISNVVMFNKSTMTAASIEAFLVTKGGTCASGHTCIKNYHQDTTDYVVPTTKVGGAFKYTQGVCSTYKGAKNQSAAQIIYEVAQVCGVNPQAIIVTLQKEQGLITGTAPTSLTYRKAMGYGCPDTASCNQDFYGFFKQVYWGARAMIRPVSNYKPLVKSAIHYSPNVKCGTRSITVTNKATSNLYTYTPYTPNKAALSNLSGSGDGCSSYGNRNFWRYFNSWFGSTVIPQPDIAFVQADFQDALGRSPSSTDEYNQGKYLLAKPSRSDFAAKIFRSSEYRKKWIAAQYLSILKRPATSADVTARLGQLVSGKLLQDNLTVALLGSSEFYTKVAGGTPSSFITTLYEYALGREPSVTNVTTWVARLKKSTRAKIAASIWNSTENDGRLATAMYATYLARPAVVTEQAYMGNYIAQHGYFATLDHVIGSSEYFRGATNRFPVTGQ